MTSTKRPRKVELCGAVSFNVCLERSSNFTELALGKQATQLFEFDAQSMPKRAFRTQLFLKQFLRFVEGFFISFRIVDQFPKHALYS